MVALAPEVHQASDKKPSKELKTREEVQQAFEKDYGLVQDDHKGMNDVDKSLDGSDVHLLVAYEVRLLFHRNFSLFSLRPFRVLLYFRFSCTFRLASNVFH